MKLYQSAFSRKFWTDFSSWKPYFFQDDDVEDEPVRHKKKKRREKRSRSKSRSEEEEDIDDDDRELLKENLGIDFAKKRKRIRMESGSDDSASEPDGQDQDAIPELDEQQVCIYVN